MAATSISFSHVTAVQRRTLIAAALGWLLDGFDVMLYALVITAIVNDFSISEATAGKIATLTLFASGIGGMLFGWIADRIGRTKALMLSILTYSFCSFASGLSTSVMMLGACRFILGLGMGGEWNTGATLVAETWPTELRAKAISVMQSTWALGYAAAALVSGIILRYHGNWRMVFFAGVLPALVVFWMRKGVPESEMWLERKHGTVAAPQVNFSEIFSRSYIKTTAALTFMNFFGMFAWWGLFTWIPHYLLRPVSKGGRGFDVGLMTIMLVALNLTGMFPGYGTFGWVADKLGRKKSCVLYTLLASLLVLLYARATDPRTLLLLGTPVAFFATGFFSGSGIIGSEVYPTRIRARALGFTYNGARTISSIAPTVIGYLGQKYGLGSAFYLCSASLFLSMLSATQLPETKGKVLE